jgi:AbrB family looped-hinge helix DNA binding protein
MNMETYATVKGQIVIPAALRRKYGIKSGTKIIVTDIGDAILLKPVTEQYLKNLQGSLKGKGGLKTLVEERRKDTKREK